MLFVGVAESLKTDAARYREDVELVEVEQLP